MASSSHNVGRGGGGGGGTATASATVADQISVAVQSTSNLLHLLQHSSPCQAQLMKLPKNLLAKASVTKNTGEILQQLPWVITSLDEHMECGLQSIPHLKTVAQLLSNMENSQLKAASQISRKNFKHGAIFLRTKESTVGRRMENHWCELNESESSSLSLGQTVYRGNSLQYCKDW